MTTHCTNNAADRDLGAYWERRFCELASNRGVYLTPLQLVSSGTSAAAFHKRTDGSWHHLTLPDVTIWTAPGEHHEIKHKRPTPSGDYGLEVYRLNALLGFARETQQEVLYTIHDWSRAGAKGSRDDMRNSIEDWVTIPVKMLEGKGRRVKFPTWKGGRKVNDEPGYLWPASMWFDLSFWWADRKVA